VTSRVASRTRGVKSTWALRNSGIGPRITCTTPEAERQQLCCNDGFPPVTHRPCLPAQRFGFQLRAPSEHREAMVDKTEVVVFNHDFEVTTSRQGGPAAANPKLGSYAGALP
jgi:hypothetical protein